MFGTYRFILAALVLISHVYPAKQSQFNLGPYAVIQFFVLSGYINSHIIKSYYELNLRGILHFYLDRFIRIYPLFFVATNLSVFFRLVFRIEDYHLSRPFTILGYIRNILLIPLNYTFFFPSFKGEIYNSPTWSLALEEQFYLIFPFLLIFWKFTKYLHGVSILITVMAIFGLLHTKFFCYFFLPGVLFYFLCGTSIFEQGFFANLRLKITVICLLFLLFLVYLSKRNNVNYIVEILCGGISGILLTSLLSTLDRQRFDEYLSNFSYGIFLFHYPVVLLLRKLAIFSGYLELLAVFGLTLFLTWLTSQYVERPLKNMRRKLRFNYQIAQKIY